MFSMKVVESESGIDITSNNLYKTC